MKKKIILFVLAFLVWNLFVGVFPEAGQEWDYQSVLLGALISLGVALLFASDFSQEPLMFFQPRRIFFLLLFIPVFSFYCAKANFEVMYYVISPHLPIKPGIVKVQSELESKTALTILANCITLTPGTLTVEATEDGVLYVHWLAMRSIDEEVATQQIAGKFEWFLKRIFEDG